MVSAEVCSAPFLQYRQQQWLQQFRKCQGGRLQHIVFTAFMNAGDGRFTSFYGGAPSIDTNRR